MTRQNATPETIASELRITPTFVNMRRIRKGFNLFQSHKVSYLETDKTGTHTFKVESASRDGLIHFVSFYDEKEIECSCEDWLNTDTKLAAEGVPFRSHVCKHGTAAWLWWQEYTEEWNAWSDSLLDETPEPRAEDFDEWEYERENWLAERELGGY